MTTAFVLSGGGSLGAVQVGMLQSLAERRITPDLLVGTSAGALNAVFVAAHGTGPAALDLLAGTWPALRRDDIFPVRAPRMLLALTGARDSLCTHRGLERLVRQRVGFARLEDAPIPIHLVATDLLSGEEVLLSEGDALTAVLASSAVPAVLPPVQRDGRTLVDGGLADNAAISKALALDADPDLRAAHRLRLRPPVPADPAAGGRGPGAQPAHPATTARRRRAVRRPGRPRRAPTAVPTAHLSHRLPARTRAAPARTPPPLPGWTAAQYHTPSPNGS